MLTVLIAEDDPATRAGLVDILEMEGYRTVATANGDETLALFDSAAPDFVCLDIMMPGRSGYDVCRLLRQRRPEVPIMFISAKSEEIDRVLGLELGADDFIVKPFGVREVVARIRAVSRRCLRDRGEVQQQQFQLGDLTVLTGELRARRDDSTIELSLRDIAILRLFADHPGTVLTRLRIFQHAWGQGSIANSRCLDQHIAQLRKRIEIDPREPQLIQTVHGAGYRYDPPA